MTIRTCVPADPQSKGGSEATVRIAKADLVPTEVNLAAEYHSFGQLEAAYRDWCEQVNARPHRETRRPPADALAEERVRLHPLPTRPFTVAFGTTRRVNWDATVSVEGVRYPVPHQLVYTRVWVRFHGDELVVTAVGEQGPEQVARHPRSTPGSPSIQAEHCGDGMVQRPRTVHFWPVRRCQMLMLHLGDPVVRHRARRVEHPRSGWSALCALATTAATASVSVTSASTSTTSIPAVRQLSIWRRTSSVVMPLCPGAKSR